MKYIAVLPIVLFALFATVHIASAQEDKRSRDTGNEVRTGQEESEPTQHDNQQKEDIPFVDEDGDGINDNRRSAVQRGAGDGNETRLRQRRRDHFIDNDGDGINDNRCSGMGIMHGKRRGQQKGGRK